jgi:membrane carboxypeptidase/penicillin-binding protein PbpC
MKSVFGWSSTIILLLAMAIVGYGLSGYFAARADAPDLAGRGDRLIKTHRGAGDLGQGRAEQILLVDDPGFWNHNGVDLSTDGAGLTTITQSVGKRVGFSDFKPGIRKIRLIGYAMGLESKLTKQEILALYLDTVWMGRGPDGPMAGYFDTSRTIYGRLPADLSQGEFLRLVAVPIAPRRLDLVQPNKELLDRVGRIERLVEKQCRPKGLRDVWLEGCA